MSAGAVAGIGIAVALGILLLAAAVFALLWRRRKGTWPAVAPRRNRDVSEMDGGGQSGPVVGGGGGGGGGDGAGGPLGQSVQMWQNKSPQSESSVVAGMSTSTGSYNPHVAAYNVGGQPVPGQYGQQQHQSPGLVSAHLGQSPASASQNGTWQSDRNSPLTNHPQGWHADSVNIPPAAPVSLHNRQTAPYEVGGGGISSQELDSTPLSGRPHDGSGTYGGRYQ